MGRPTIEDARSAKAEIIAKLKDLEGFAGAGIGEHDGRFTVRVNWRVLPKDIKLPDRIGDVEVTHHEVGSLRPQAE
jgi:hypothetical protein